ncbi:MAG TPA: PLP-dependent aminotransferase family protein [Ktedonobacterales bacterium]|nr:PLP-dependent aminotransferase family protein [Ktedonobacterales bacterium]
MPIQKRRGADLLMHLDRSTSGDGLTRQIYTQLRTAILEGRLRAGDRLPPSRDLARDLGVARLTVATAYEWLGAEGYVYGRVGAGTFVAAVFAEPALPLPANANTHHHAPPARSDAAPVRQEPPVPLSTWARRIATIPLAGISSAESAACMWDMRPSVGAADAFPWARWRRTVGWPDPLAGDAPPASVAMSAGTASSYWDALLGPLETREAIAAWLRRSRAVRCVPEQILVAGSVQQMLALLARLLIEPGQQLLVEDPSYVGFHAAFLAEGAVLAAMPVDEHGLRVEALPARDVGDGGTDEMDDMDGATSRLAIVTPSHQYPTGVTLTLERRVALLEWARRAGVVLVEDDYDGDLRLEGQPLEALRGLDDRDEVIYLGTFAKALYPAVRLGFAVLPHWLIEPVARARAASDRHPAWRDAMAVARFIEAGELERHLARMRRLYRGRRDALTAALREHLDDLITIGPADAGIHLLARLPDGVDDVALVDAAQRHSIACMPLSPHYQGSARPGLLLGFGGMSEARLAEGVRRLAPLVREAVATAEGAHAL